MKPTSLALLIFLFVFSCDKPTRDLNPEKLIGGFELLSPEFTGIDFVNSINESKTVNHIYYNQIYSGAGVALGDINNDGLVDVFFCGNQVSDRLYLNKGDFKFEDITKKSRVAKNSGWSWGVTMVDINNDGFLDIYVSRNGESMNPEERRNQLYVNNGDLTFKEEAFKYGLADVGFSSQAAFFDMDNDGDLDMYQVNQLPDARLFRRYKIPQKRTVYYTDKLYENVNGVFKDVSEKAGISRDLTYGLSISVADFNKDGWADFYVANDYDKPDFMYYNNGNGTFTNVINDKLRHISQFSMGTDTGDINNDGHLDLVTLDMAAEDHYRSKTNMASMSTAKFDSLVNTGNHYQYMSNTLQINNAGENFSDIANMAGIAKTDWSWSVLLADFDNDGLKDMAVSNGIKKDVRNNDFLQGLYSELKTDSKDFFAMSKKAPSEPLPNYIYRNTGDLKFEKMTTDWGFSTPSFSSGMAYGDLDNDGDLDLVLNNMKSPAFVYKNNSNGNFLKIKLLGPDSNKLGIGTHVRIKHSSKSQIHENRVTRGYFSSVEPGIFFGLGKDKVVDSIEVTWPDGKQSFLEDISANRIIEIKYSKANGKPKLTPKKETFFTTTDLGNWNVDYKHEENSFDDFKTEVLLPHKLSQNGPFVEVADVNNDGLDDMFFGGAAGQSGVLFYQTENKNFKRAKEQPWESDKDSEDLGCLFFDADGDEDLDLYIVSGGSEFPEKSKLYQDRLYLNDGKGNFSKSKALPKLFESSQCVKASDIDNDGDLDLFVGTRLKPNKYPAPSNSYILINNNGKFEVAGSNVNAVFQNLGMVTDAVFSDIDGDKDEDLLLVGEWMNIKVFKNNQGIFSDVSKNVGTENSRGIWWSISAGDLDNDGDEDYVLGNLGSNNKFKASKEHPFKIYADDFDDNGTNDIVLAKFYKDDYVPVRGRECTSQQMPYVAEKFKDYHSFADSKLIDILPEDKIDNAINYQISSFESVFLINENGKLIMKKLPKQVQISPIKSSIITDVNNDGLMDIVAVGNHYGAEVETVRYDASIGCLLINSGNNNFKYIEPAQSGINIPKDSRDIKLINLGERLALVVSNNNNTSDLLVLDSKK